MSETRGSSRARVDQLEEQYVGLSSLSFLPDQVRFTHQKQVWLPRPCFSSLNLSSSFVGQKLSTRNKHATPGIVIFKSPKCSVDSPYGGNVQKFPRSSVWDPYKRLGVSPGASEEEIWSSRNFLLQQYVGHESSEESIEAAFERILMDSFWKRKKSKINLKSKLKKQVEESPSWVKNLLNFVELPPKEVIFRRLFLFAFMGGWSIMNSAEGGPAFQVAVSLAACIYFLNEKTKSVARASLIGFGALVAGWVCGSFLVPMIPSVLLRPTWTLELLTSLVVYVYLFLACTFLK
ncbi:unnamed protein product [Rhodiola kirilowii]